MNRINHPIFRMFAFSLMVFQCTGCGTYRLAAMPGMAEPQAETVQVETIKVGADVKMELKTGEILTGKVSAVSDEFVALGKIGNFGPEQNEYLWSDIQQIEVFKAAIFKSVILTASGFFVSFVALCFYGLSQMND